MRTVSLDVCGREYTLCYSLQAMDALLERYGSFEAVSDAMTVREAAEGEPDNTREVLSHVADIAEVLLRAGYLYESACGTEQPPEPPSVEALKASCSFRELRDAAMGAIIAGSTREVEVEPSKKAPAETETAL